MKYRISDCIIGDVFTHNKKGHDATVIDRNESFILLSDGKKVTYRDFPGINDNYDIKQRFKPKFNVGDVILDKRGSKYFVLATGRKMILQQMGAIYFLHGCEPDHYELM